MKQVSKHFLHPALFCLFFSAALVLSFLTGCGGSSSGQDETQVSADGTVLTQGGSSDGQSGASSASGSEASGGRKTVKDFQLPETPGTLAQANDAETAFIDYSNTAEGYICIKDTSDTDRVQIQITNPDGSVYPYPLAMGDWEAFPLTCGDGSYTANVLEHLSGDQYAIALSLTLDVKLNDEFRPFLYPNQYVDYGKDSRAIALGCKLSDQSADDLNYISNVYNFVTQNITYDTELAANLPNNYIPDVDHTLETKTGICFDYASLMTAMLRSQGIPTKLQVGYSGTVYHAWISTWLKETGWVDNIIEFDGKSWTLMDPTLGANNDKKDVAEYVGDGTNYTLKYNY